MLPNTNRRRNKRKLNRASKPYLPTSSLYRQLYAPHLHKATTFTYLVSSEGASIATNLDLGNALLSAPNYKQLSYVYNRYRILLVEQILVPLAPLQGAGQTPLYIRYQPVQVIDPISPELITDSVTSKTLDSNKTTPTKWSFIPKNSQNPANPPAVGITEDKDGYLPFGLNSIGFAQPFFGCTQYWQDVCAGYGEKEWSVQTTFYIRCCMSD